jgi:hypothetical protein
MVWVHDRTDSILVAILMNASLMTFWTMLTPVTLAGFGPIIYYLALTAAMWVVIAGVAAIHHRQIARQSLQSPMT